MDFKITEIFVDLIKIKDNNINNFNNISTVKTDGKHLESGMASCMGQNGSLEIKYCDL